MSVIRNYQDLVVFQKAFEVACKVFTVSKDFPREERYSLTDQIRRSSRSIAANIAEAWAKKLYIKAFVNKLSDALAEALETEVWLRFCLKHEYISAELYESLMLDYEEIRKMLTSMINNSDKFQRNQ